MVSGRRRVTYSHRKMCFLGCNKSASRSGCHLTKRFGDRTQLTFNKGANKKWLLHKKFFVVVQLVEDPLKREGGVKGNEMSQGDGREPKLKGLYMGPFYNPTTQTKVNRICLRDFLKRGVSRRVIVYGGSAFRVRSV